ncbi:MAG: hypothetical protein LBE36_10690 [Flavobacteriaceae bacterium]|jgi:hypothetical protein|nr:hypothetical protein [Flavobacteriaceae bacterium]
MKKLFVLVVAVLAFVSCDKVKDAMSGVAEMGDEIDYQFLSKPEEVKKWYDAIVEKSGDNAKVMDEVKFWINRPSKEGMIKKEGEKDYLHISIVYQDNVDKRRVEEINYFGHTSGWQVAEKKEIQVIGGGAEDFKLEDELFDFGQVTLDNFNKVMADAMKKYKDDAKYEYQYISNVTINIVGFYVTVKGKLKSNAQEKSEYYKTDFQGNPR